MIGRGGRSSGTEFKGTRTSSLTTWSFAYEPSPSTSYVRYSGLRTRGTGWSGRPVVRATLTPSFGSPPHLLSTRRRRNPERDSPSIGVRSSPPGIRTRYGCRMPGILPRWLQRTWPTPRTSLLPSSTACRCIRPVEYRTVLRVKKAGD